MTKTDVGSGSSHPRVARPLLRNERGQALVETGIVILLLTSLFLGVVEFGRAWMVGSMITQAARAGARAAAVTPLSNRDPSGNIISTSGIETMVRNQIRNVLDASTTSSLGVNVTQSTTSGIPIVTVQVTGNVPTIFNFVATQFAISRSVTFRDEGHA